MRADKIFSVYSVFVALALGVFATSYIPHQRGILGLTNGQIFLIEAYYSLTLLLCEVPTGFLADRYGRVRSLLCGTALWAFGMGLVFWVRSFPVEAFLFIVAGVGNACMTGADEAWFKDSMGAESRDAEYEVAVSRVTVYRGAALWFGGILGVLCLVKSPGSQWLLAAAFIVCSGLVAFFWMRGRGEVQAQHRLPELQALRQGFEVLRRVPALRWAMAAGVLFGLYWVVQLQWAAVSFERDGVRWFLLTWTLSALGFSLGGYLAQRFLGKPGASILLGLALLFVVMLALPFMGPWFMPLMLFMWRCSRGLFDSALTVFVQNRIQSAYRATYGSLQSLVVRMGVFLLFLLIGWWSDIPDYLNAVRYTYLLSAAILFVGGSILFLWFLRRRAQFS
ncbi:MFS transporter [Patescibacteria group bacterium]|nr:MFS transporter [Patescibacteria group bacterium]MBP9710139.1 MFS transporter [Patescibacteria group bacterium]